MDPIKNTSPQQSPNSKSPSTNNNNPNFIPSAIRNHPDSPPLTKRNINEHHPSNLVCVATSVTTELSTSPASPISILEKMKKGELPLVDQYIESVAKNAISTFLASPELHHVAYLINTNNEEHKNKLIECAIQSLKLSFSTNEAHKTLLYRFSLYQKINEYLNQRRNNQIEPSSVFTTTLDQSSKVTKQDLRLINNILFNLKTEREKSRFNSLIHGDQSSSKVCSDNSGELFKSWKNAHQDNPQELYNKIDTSTKRMRIQLDKQDQDYLDKQREQKELQQGHDFRVPPPKTKHFTSLTDRHNTLASLQTDNAILKAKLDQLIPKIEQQLCKTIQDNISQLQVIISNVNPENAPEYLKPIIDGKELSLGQISEIFAKLDTAGSDISINNPLATASSH